MVLRTRQPVAAELRFAAMGTDAHIVVVGGAEGLAERARRRVDDLEARWSRFRTDSETSRLNAAAGAARAVSAETRVLVRCAVMGWHASAGRFDPTVHDALVAAGYDRDLALVRRRGDVPAARAQPSPGCAGIVVDDAAGTVALPEGVRIDAGGIGKGLAADLVVDETLAAGAAGVCVNLGGDLRVAGKAPDGPGWRIAVPHHRSGEPERTLHLLRGAVATSSTLTRRWRAGGAVQHHVIDPGTGRPGGHLEAVTVVAATGWQAEVAAKAALLAPPDEQDRLLNGLATGALLVGPTSATSWGAMERFLDPRPWWEGPV
jgi:FAD:protein FMN transferase